MKKWIIIIMGVLMVLNVNAQGYGHCSYGNSPYGNCVISEPVPITEGGGGGTSGTEVNEQLIIQLFGMFTNFTLDLVKTLTSSTLDNVLQYRIITPSEAQQQDIVQITNLFTNEGKSEMELTCINFFDINKNLRYEINEPSETFSKKINIKTETIIDASVIVPEIKDDIYLIVGTCQSLNGSNTTAFNKIKINKNANKGIITLFFDWIKGLLVPSLENIPVKSGLNLNSITETEASANTLQHDIQSFLKENPQLPYIIAGAIILFIALWYFGILAMIWGYLLSLGIWGVIIMLVIIILLFNLIRWF